MLCPTWNARADNHFWSCDYNDSMNAAKQNQIIRLGRKTFSERLFFSILLIFQFRELLVSLVSSLWFTLSLSVGLRFCSLYLGPLFCAFHATRWIFRAHNFIGFFRTWNSRRIQIGTIYKPSKINKKSIFETNKVYIFYFRFSITLIFDSSHWTKIHNYFYTLLIMAHLIKKKKWRETIINVF